jgi:hypothetical protein
VSQRVSLKPWGKSTRNPKFRAFNDGSLAKRMLQSGAMYPGAGYRSRVCSLGLALLFAFAYTASSATLKQLSFEEMTSLSTEIVRGSVTGTHTAQAGGVIFTHYRVQVAERWKGPERSAVDVAVQGGTLRGLTQNFAGVPELKIGSEYVMFLWTGAKGPTQLIGLQQGLFQVSPDENGRRIAGRPAIREMMLGSSGKPITDSAVQVRLEEMRARIRSSVAGAAK